MLRDTDEDWRGIAGEPFYGVFSDPKWFREQLTSAAIAEFYETGEADIAGLLDKLRIHFGPFSPKTAIDFGCGAGRLTCAMAKHVEHVLGVDVAPGMIEEARKWAPRNAEFGHDIPAQKVDWVNSVIVFQHIHPAKGFPLLAELLDRIAEGGGITLQFGIYKERSALPFATNGMEAITWDGENLRTLDETPRPSGEMMMFDYDLTRVIAMLHKAGIDRMYLEHTNHGGNHGVFVLGRKN